MVKVRQCQPEMQTVPLQTNPSHAPMCATRLQPSPWQTRQRNRVPEDARVRPGFGQCAVAPTVSRFIGLALGFRERFVRQSRDEHFLGAQIFAKMFWLHNQALS